MAILLAVASLSWACSGGVGHEPPPELFALPDFALVNRDGSTVESADLDGSPWVANFIFTRCALYCPRSTSRMAHLGRALPSGLSVARVSFTVDPAFDTHEVLSAYADAYGIDDPEWRFLTGDAEALRTLIFEGFRLPVEDTEPILHSNRFVLVDGNGTIRGYYEATDGAELERLIADLAALQMARGHNTQSRAEDSALGERHERSR